MKFFVVEEDFVLAGSEFWLEFSFLLAELTILATKGDNVALTGVDLLLFVPGKRRESVHFILEELELKGEEYNNRKKNPDEDDGQEHES